MKTLKTLKTPKNSQKLSKTPKTPKNSQKLPKLLETPKTLKTLENSQKLSKTLKTPKTPVWSRKLLLLSTLILQWRCSPKSWNFYKSTNVHRGARDFPQEPTHGTTFGNLWFSLILSKFPFYLINLDLVLYPIFSVISSSYFDILYYCYFI